MVCGNLLVSQQKMKKKNPEREELSEGRLWQGQYAGGDCWVQNNVRLETEGCEEIPETESVEAYPWSCHLLQNKPPAGRASVRCLTAGPDAESITLKANHQTMASGENRTDLKVLSRRLTNFSLN